jgi:hypothetical protein
MRNFGIEIELVGISKETSLEAIQNAGLKAKIETYNHEDHADGTWKITTDASVINGHEVVSPILHGEEGLREAMMVANALEAAGATINKSCGLHVHFNALDLTTDAIRMICKRYMKFEGEIDAFMPLSRRENNNRFCRSTKLCFMNNSRFESAATKEALARSVSGRYYKVNLEAYLAHHTIEFRQHSGTVDSQKIACWVRFLDDFITESIHQSEVNAAQIRLQPAQQNLIDLIKADSGMDAESLQNRLGLQPHSLRGAISILRKKGFNIASRRINGATWYRAFIETTMSEADSLFKGIDNMVAGFYKMRAIALAA